MFVTKICKNSAIVNNYIRHVLKKSNISSIFYRTFSSEDSFNSSTNEKKPKITKRQIEELIKKPFIEQIDNLPEDAAASLQFQNYNVPYPVETIPNIKKRPQLTQIVIKKKKKTSSSDPDVDIEKQLTLKKKINMPVDGKLQPDDVLKAWLAQFPDTNDEAIRAISPNDSNRDELLREQFLRALVASLDAETYNKFVGMFKNLVNRLRMIAGQIASTSAKSGSVDNQTQQHSLARQQISETKLTFYRATAKLLGNDADALVPQLSKHLDHITIASLNNARERVNDNDMMSYAAAFLREDDAVSEMGDIARNDGVVPIEIAHNIYKHIDVENDPNSQFLWGKLDKVRENYHRVFVTNLPNTITTRDLMQAFAKCGKVMACEVFREDPLHSRSNSKEFNEYVTRAVLMKLQKDLTHSSSISRKEPAHAWVYFKDIESQKRALSPSMSIFGLVINDVLVTVQDPNLKTTLMITGFRSKMTQSDVSCVLEDLISPLLSPSSMVNVQISQKSNLSNRGYAMVEFDSPESAFTAFRAIDGSSMSWPHNNLDDAPVRSLKCYWTNYIKRARSSTYHHILPFFPSD